MVTLIIVFFSFRIQLLNFCLIKTLILTKYLAKESLI